MKKLLCVFVILLTAQAQSQAQPQSSAQGPRPDGFALYIDGAKYSSAEKQAIRQKALEFLRGRSNRPTIMTGLEGPIAINSACPVGYVRKANYRFNIKEIEITRDEGVDCDGPNQCRAWQVEATPEDPQQLYDFSIQLQCSADDTLRTRDYAARRSSPMPDLGRGRGGR